MFYWLFIFTLVFAEKTVPVEFEEKIETCLTQDVLWLEFEKAMVSSEDSWLWPESSSTVKGEGLFNEARIEVTYKSFWASPTYSYLLSEVVAGESFTYTAIEGEHPFRGGATVRVGPVASGSFLHWKGLYLTESSDWMERQFFSRYSKRFFQNLQNNIETQEKSLCQP